MATHSKQDAGIPKGDWKDKNNPVAGKQILEAEFISKAGFKKLFEHPV